MKRLLIFGCFLCSVFVAFAQKELDPSIEMTTFTYAQKDTSILKLDKYRLKQSDDKQPCLFFVFGGAFARGTRNSDSFTDYFTYFARQGFTVISIDYRLGMKGQKKIAATNYKRLKNAIKNAINMAVDDLFDATEFTLEHADEWNIDTSRIILTGSSAGAITVMHAEYEKRNNAVSASKLPQSFNYAGVVSFSGAIFSTDGGLKWNAAPCPVYLFHGDKDKTVPYNKIRFFKLGFFGSKNIAKGLKSKGSSYLFASYKGAGHEVSSFPMRECREEVLQFIETFVFQGRKMQVETQINELDKVKNRKKESYKNLYDKKK